MISEVFASGESLLHRLDPRLKIVVASAFAVLIAVSHRFPTLIAAVSIGLVLLWQARLDARALVRRLLPVNALIVFFWLVLPWTVPGEPWSRLGPLVFTHEGLRLAAEITLKANAILMVLVALVATHPIATLGYALSRLGVPAKLVQLLLFTYRYIIVIEQEYTRLYRAARMRGFQPRTSLHTYKTFAYLLGMLFVRAANRAQRVYHAMQCRGFRGRFYSLHDFSFTTTDTVWAMLFAGLLIGLAWLEWGVVQIV